MMLAKFRSRYINVHNTEELISRLEDILPLPTESYKIIDIQGSVKKFRCTVNCKDVIEPGQFMKDIAEKSNLTLHMNTPRYTKNEFKKHLYFRCHHNTRYQGTMSVKELKERNPSARHQNVNCPFSLVVKYKSNESSEYPVVIQMDWEHYHSTVSLMTLSFKDIPDHVAAAVKDLFDKGYTPALAYSEFLRQKDEELSNLNEMEKLLIKSDRSKVPRRPDFNSMFTDYHRLKYGTLNLDQMYKKLSERISKINIDDPDTNVMYQKYDADADDPFILVLVTPLMKRVHEKVHTSAELVFFDSSGGMEEYNLRLFFMVTHTPVGALPLGIIITSDETLDTIVRAHELFIANLPEGAFYGRGKEGPAIIMTDNCSELHDGLNAIWPKAILLLCIFHLMQQLWRWLFDKNHKISIEDRQSVMTKFKDVVYAANEDDFEDHFSNLKESVSKYQGLSSYLDSLYNISDKWALTFRKTLKVRGNHTNNYVEAQFLVIKDTVLNRTKEVNINGLIDKLTTDLNSHYKNKLLSVSAGSFDGIYSNRFKGRSKGESKTGIGYQLPSVKLRSQMVEKIEKIGESMYAVPSFSDEDNCIYIVDMDMGMCSCPIGSDGSVCKHQFIVWTYKHKESVNFIPYLDPAKRKEYSYIATGMVLGDEYYEGLHDQVVNAGLSVENPLLESMSTVEFAEDATVLNEEEACSSTTVPSIGRGPVDLWTADELKTLLSKTNTTLINLVESREYNQNFLKGLVTFCDRVEKYKDQPSKLSSAFHSFGNIPISSKRITAKSLVKKACNGKKIPVMPNVRRVSTNGSKTAEVKGMRKHLNPFDGRKVSKKRVHSLADNVRDNVGVPKKAGRSMASRTKFLNTSKQSKHDK